MTINERIRDLLKEKGKRQAELAEYIGVSQNTVSDWINKGKNPSANLAYLISEFFQVSLDYLFTGNEYTNNQICELSKDEKELIETYKELDRRGQHKVHSIIYEEMDRMKEQKGESSKNKSTG